MGDADIDGTILPVTLGERQSSQASLAPQEERYHTLFDTMAQGVVYQDATGHIIDANAAAQEILGLSLDALCVRTSDDTRWSALGEDSHPLASDEHPSMRALKSGQPVRNAVMGVMHPIEHRYRWLLVSAIPLYRDGDAQPYQVYTTFDDITVRREGADLAMAVLESMTEAFFTLDHTWHFTYLNHAAERLLQRQHEELLGRSVWSAFPEALRSSFLAHYERALQQRVAVTFEEFYEPLGAWFEVRTYPTPYGLSVYFHDITERRRAAERHSALLQQEREARAAAEHTIQRLTQVQQVAVALSAAASRSELYRVILSHGMAALGARKALIALLSADGEALEVVETVGYPAESVALWRYIPLTEPTPLTDAVRERRPVWIESQAAMIACYPALEAADWGHGELAALPLHLDGRDIGVLGVTFIPQSVPAEDHLFAETLANLCAQALDRTRLYEEARRSQDSAEVAAQIAVKRAQELEATFDAMSDGVVIYDIAAGVARQNRAMRQLSGYSEAPAPLDFTDDRLSLSDTHGQPLSASERPVARVLRGDRLTGPDTIDVRMYTPWGQMREFNVGGTPLLDAEEHITGAVCVFRDVTEERALARAVTGERDRLQQVLDTMPVGVIIADMQERFMVANPLAHDIFGTDLLQRPVPMSNDNANLRRLDGSLLPALQRPLQRSLLLAETVYGEQAVVRMATTGRDSVVLINSAPLFDERRVQVGAVVVLQDITPLKEIERARDEFLSSISHDLKTPLTSISGLAQLLYRQAQGTTPLTSERVTQSTRMILNASDSMARLLDDLLDITRIQLGQPLGLDRRATDLVALLRKVVERQHDLSPHHVRFEAVVEHLLVPLDAARIERVIANLLSNAIKYSPQGTAITVRVAVELLDHASVAVISVQDAGVGIPAADLPHIFERFHRGSNVIAQIQGTGIGLASSQQIVAEHDGTITVESTVGIGSIFTVRLPLSPPEPR